METYATWTRDEHPADFDVPEGCRVEWYYDEDHLTRGSYAYDTEAETAAAEDYELEKLRSGAWVVLGYQTFTPAGMDDSLWGCVVEASAAALVDLAKMYIVWPTREEIAAEMIGQAEAMLTKARGILGASK